MKKMTLASMVRASLIAAIYAVLAMLLPMFSYGPISFRASEGLVLLPIIMPEAIPGLIVGCFIANLGSPFGIIDIVCGTLCTAVAAYLTYKLRHNHFLALLPPILINGFGVSAYLAFFSQEAYLLTAFSVLISEAAVIISLGLPIL